MRSHDAGDPGVYMSTQIPRRRRRWLSATLAVLWMGTVFCLAWNGRGALERSTAENAETLREDPDAARRRSAAAALFRDCNLAMEALCDAAEDGDRESLQLLRTLMETAEHHVAQCGD